MKIGKEVVVGLFALVSLTASLMFFNISLGQASLALVYLDPTEIAETLSANFTVNINVENVTNLFAWQSWLKWDPQLLEVVNATEGDFLKTGGSTDWVVAMNQTEGWIFAASVSYGSSGLRRINGSGTLARATFRGTNLGKCVLDLYNTKLLNSTVEVSPPPCLGDANGDLIVNALDVYEIGKAFGASSGEPRYNPNADFNNDGSVDFFDLLCYYVNFGKDYHNAQLADQPVEAAVEAQDGNVTLVQPIIQALPSEVSVKAGESFNVSIGVTGVLDFYSLQYRISWNPELLGVAALFEGDLLRSLGKSFFTYTVQEGKGYAHIANSLIGPVEVPKISNGTLSTIEFYAAKAGSSFLNVSDTPYKERGVTVTVGEGTEKQAVTDQKQSFRVAEGSVPGVLTVGPGQQFSTVQGAVDAASPGDKIHVYSGTYAEHVIINKFNIMLIGQGKDNTIIKAPTNQEGTAAVEVLENDAKIMEFTIQDGYKGVEVFEYNGSMIRDNIIKNNFVGIDLVGYTSAFAAKNTLLGNNITGNSGAGAFFWVTGNDTIRGNNITDNYEGIQINSHFSDSVICFNNIVNNAIQVYPPSPPPDNIQWYCTLDNNNKGNYWNLIPAPNPDPYPLQNLWNPIEGDIDRDGRVIMLDISPAAAAFGTKFGDYRWNPYADTVKDGKVDIIDIARIAKHYNQIDP